MFSFPGLSTNPFVIASLALQIYFGIHAVRSGRYGWLFILLFFPFLGCVIYFFAEYLPELKENRRARRLADGVADSVVNTLDPGRRTRELEAKLKLTPSFANRQALDEEYMAEGRVDEAITLYDQNSVGIHAEDPGTLKGLSFAWYRKGDFPKAREYVERYRKKRESSLPGEIDLLYADLLEKSGDITGAIAEYRSLAKKNLGEEPRYRAGMLLKIQGRDEEAKSEFEEIVRTEEALPSQYRKANRHWVELAKKELKR